MSNIEKKKLKHGIFSYYTNDRYIGKSLSQYGEWSEGEVDLLKQILPNNGNVIEIGSNIGTHTVPLAKHVSNGGIVWAIEPQSQNYTLLSKNIKDNNLNNVKTLKLAISSKKGNAYMDTFDENSINNYGDSKIHKNNFKNSESVTVTTLDQLFEDCFKEINIQLIKCDAQGQELNIILGSNKIIDIYKPVIYLENDDINTSKTLIETIKNLGYLMFWHLPLLYNKSNFLNNKKNIFPKMISCNMFCVHKNTNIKLNQTWKKYLIIDNNQHPFKK